MKRNVACSSTALRELSLQLGWMCGAEKALSVPFISALFLGEESDFTFACVFSPQEYGRHLYSLLSAVVSSSRDKNCLCGKCHRSLPLFFLSLILNTVVNPVLNSSVNRD